jgi:hypothetical protein
LQETPQDVQVAIPCPIFLELPTGVFVGRKKITEKIIIHTILIVIASFVISQIIFKHEHVLCQCTLQRTAVALRHSRQGIPKLACPVLQH